MQPVDQLAEALRQSRQSLTKPRLAVFVALQGEEPLTIRDLIARCPGVDRASVYRTVALFEQLGIVQRIQMGWKYKLELSDAFHKHHHHATCLGCDRSFILPEDSKLETYVRHMAESVGLRLERHQLELQGYCPACQKKSLPF